MPREFSRSQRVGEQIRKELASIIQMEMKDPRLGMVTVSAVDVSRDMSYATAYVTSFGCDNSEEKKQALDVLVEAAGYLRTRLSSRMRLRFTPELRFHYDESLSRGHHILNLLKKNKTDDGSAVTDGTECVD